MRYKAFWSALEYTCRLLGIFTAAVLIGVGVETLQQGQFKSLAFYLLFSGVAVTVCEGCFFISLFLEMCFTYEPDSLTQAFWKRARRPGSFQKFLGYTLLSVACFLHPVLVWHVTIPGEDPVSGRELVQVEEKHGLIKSPGHKETQPRVGQYVDPSATVAAQTIVGDTEQTYTFHEAQREQHRSLLGHMKSILKGSKNRSAAPAAPAQPAAPPATRKQVHFQEKVVQIIPSVSESLEDMESEAEETTSDTTPILTPPDAPIILTPLSSTGFF
ncbi:Transmembrane protein 72 [Buceros rhinoceros silvestris]|uniref:Transmembrane protein 72 n=1 Tax=Buceros rhinoceros silvestris TaxID=175836 RepID=A0A091H528_BUCRH|nr:Transmembrane protein 72 [Buceros rhinoceros silvestris]